MIDHLNVGPLDFNGRLIIHVGTHKTGTTSIQKALDSDYDRLKRSGILFPKAGRYRNGALLHFHHPLMLSLLDEYDQPASEHILSLRDEISGAHPDTVILSSEVLSREYLSSQVFSDLRKIFPSAQKTWIVYLRRQDSLAMSRYAEHIKMGLLSWPDSIRHILRSDFLDHRLRLERLKHAVGDDEIVPVSFDAQKSRLMLSFFEASQLEHPNPLPESPKENVSLPWTTLYCLRVNNAFPAPVRRVGRRLILGASQRIFGTRAGHFISRAPPLSSKKSAEILYRYNASNRWVETTYWKGIRHLTNHLSSGRR